MIMLLIVQSITENPVFILAGLILLFMLVLGVLISKFLRKAAPGTALIKTGLGLTIAKVSTSSAIIIPLLHRVEIIDLTVKPIRIHRRKHDSLSCADGIRAEVEVDFYIKINPIDEDIRKVANSIGCGRASSIESVRELFEAKFSDALKTAGSKLSFDQLFQNRKEFKDEILKALGQEGDHEVVLNGYRLDDVAIQYLEQLSLSEHDDNNVLDARGIKEIAHRTAAEAESANQRLNEKTTRIAEQNQEAETRQLEIVQDLSMKRARQEREIQEIQSRELSAAKKTIEEQNTFSETAEIERKRSIEIANQNMQEQIKVKVKSREMAELVAEEDKIKAIELAKIRRESEVAEQLKEKLSMLEQTAVQEAQKIRAEEQAVTVREVEKANREKQIELISAEKRASTQLIAQQVSADSKAYNLLKESESAFTAAKFNLQSAEIEAKKEIIEAEKEAKKDLLARNVETDEQAYKLITVAQASLEAAKLDFEAAENRSEAIRRIGLAEAEIRRAHLEAENSIGKTKILADSIKTLIPLLPEIVEKLMAPAEHIDSIKFLHINGMNNGGSSDSNGLASTNSSSPMGGIMNTLMNVGLAMPMIKEIIRSLGNDSEFGDIISSLKKAPGGKQLLDYIEKFGSQTAEVIED
ncbi:MAG: hypothetical protein RIS47_804 [Bacteroidota bacterium]